mgnify:CR=1 FL=1
MIGLIDVNNMQMENTVLQVPIEDIIPNRFQPRLSFDDSSLNDLASSIKQHGIIQPLVLRRKNDKYEIIAGERRYKAARMAGLITVPAIISNLDDNASAEVAIVENIQRKDLTAIEEAKSYQALLDKGYMTQEELARKMGLSQSAISNKLRLLSLDEEVQDAILAEKISERHARTLLKVPSHEKQKELLNKVIKERMTVKQLEDEIKKNEGSAKEVNQEEIPIINSTPDINNVINNSVDINKITNSPEELFTEEVTPKTVTPEKFFSNPEKMPNKFFNFLEDTAANMNVHEEIPIIEIAPEEKTKDNNSITKTDNIEMLDDFIVPTTAEVKVEDDYLDSVLKTIRGLNLDSDKVVVKEMNLPTEYHINIIIKKDKI